MGLDNAAVHLRRKLYSRGRGKWSVDSERNNRENDSEMKAMFAHLPRPFDDGGYLRGKHWSGIVREASDISLYRDLLVPSDVDKIVSGLERFDWETHIVTVQRPWWAKHDPTGWGPQFQTHDDLERHYREQTIPGIKGYFKVCQRYQLGIVSWY